MWLDCTSSNTDAPIEAPQRFVSLYSHFNDPKKETFTAMVSVVDESVKNVTTVRLRAALMEAIHFRAIRLEIII